ncbi:BaiN/RdsA family NAD(P)/FAD-dependent oxidoreductase [Sediminitomix flava]|uniref:Flavoprotein n=1 Tax=Sediminitomix flava TaxID=379075 RepID=A0A315Z1E6_SEDFL|nr:NAD(P)/FAD-dependent oxidoreductase [Sediminitomix flava]PWJ36125.1 hypothetical protein BC781_109141 [Sediminitomix flava]
MKVAVIGGGAAGFFSAIAAKENHPDAKVSIFEKSNKFLSKVKISGGGRCNVTNGCTSISELSKAYPRGEKRLKKAFKVFNTKHTMEWFESRGVPLVIQEDNCVFPQAQDSQVIIDCFMREARRLRVNLQSGKGVKSIKTIGEQLQLEFIGADHGPELFDKVIVTTGGSPKRKGLEWLETLDHQIEAPVPSLFTFNMPNESITKLMGVVVENAQVSIQGMKYKSQGPLLVTHWGMSGPAVLKASAFGARTLSEQNYEFKAQVNWVNEINNETVANQLYSIIEANPKKILANIKPFSLPERLWFYMLEKCDLPQDKRWGELGKKGVNKLVNIFTNDIYQVRGKTTFKEEFVTCGGVSLADVDFNSMQSRKCPNLYFAGEVLDIDAITGGYNFQAAWTTGFIAGKLN